MKKLLSVLKKENIKVFGIEGGTDGDDISVNLCENGDIHIQLTPYAKPAIYQLCTWDGKAMVFRPVNRISDLVEKIRELFKAPIGSDHDSIPGNNPKQDNL